MSQIQCPNCHTMFTVDKSNYTQILEQVRTREFQAEVEKRMLRLIKFKPKDSMMKSLVKKTKILSHCKMS